MNNKLKLNNNNILKLNNNIYIPFQLHNLPTYYNKININNIIKYKSLIYINIIELKNKKSILNLLNSSKLNKYSLN
jgi:hypothetical protein|tara:strand:+ start:53 stop:280 length:228 start_codon:yes stop_codon:yes gene_type:complete